MARKLHVRGLLRSTDFAKAAAYSRLLPDSWEVVLEGMLETDWQSHLQQRRQLGELWPPSTLVCVSEGEQGEISLESLANLVLETNGRLETLSEEEAKQRAEASYIERLSLSQCRYVRWEVAIGEEPPRKVVLELAEFLCPKTVAAFWHLACGNGFLTYRGSSFHRVVPDGYIEGGLLKTSSGQTANCTHSGDSLLDENYAYRHDRPGVLGLSRSTPNRNGSAFYITLRPLASLDTKNVAFGRVVEGFEVIHEIARVPTKNQRPLLSCRIIRSGPHFESDRKVLREESQPRVHREHTRTKSKLEDADIETLLQRREAIVKDIEKTAEELSEEEAMLSLVSEVISTRE